MNDEQRLAQQLRDFYIDDADRSHDRDAILRGVLDSVHVTPQQRRRRWWPFRRHAALTSALPSRELQPEHMTVTTNGQTAASSGSGPARLSGIAVAVAAVALALFGGFLLLGLLGPESPDTPLPGASSSASPEATSTPSETPMRLQTPIATALAIATMAPGTGVTAVEPDFVAVEVEPGVERIVSDGADYDSSALPDDIRYAFEDIALAPNGDVFVAAYRYHTGTGRTEGPFVWELGAAGETGPADGFPADFEKIIVDADGDLVVASPSGIRRLDGDTWVDSPESHVVQTGGGTVWFAQPGDVGDIGPGAPTDHRGGVLVLSSDYAGYAVGDEVGYRFVKDWPTWWESCSEVSLGYRSGTGCDDRSVRDGRGVGAGHDDDVNRALYLEDVETRRIASPPGGDAVWVLGGPGIEDLWSGRSTENGAIFRIDDSAPGFECPGC
jgi:hypothetical protein